MSSEGERSPRPTAAPFVPEPIPQNLRLGSSLLEKGKKVKQQETPKVPPPPSAPAITAAEVLHTSPPLPPPPRPRKVKVEKVEEVETKRIYVEDFPGYYDRSD